MKWEEASEFAQKALEGLKENSVRELRRKLEDGQERLKEIEAEKEKHQYGIYSNDSYYAMRRTSPAENALATYHYESKKELEEEEKLIKLQLALLPLLLEGRSEDEDY